MPIEDQCICVLAIAHLSCDHGLKFSDKDELKCYCIESYVPLIVVRKAS